MLENPTYVGRREAFRYVQVKASTGGKTVTLRPEEDRIALPHGVVEPLVSEATFAAAQARLEINAKLSSRNMRYPADAALLRGFVRCGHRGGSMCVKRVGPGGRYYHYRCIRGMAHKVKCQGSSIPSHWIDPVVWRDFAGNTK